MTASPIIVWFRRDLRLADNPALSHAAAMDAPLVPLYVSGWEDGHRWAPGEAGRWWLGRSLERLADSLAALGAPLVLSAGRAEEMIPSLCRDVGARQVVWNRLYEPYSRVVDQQVSAVLEREGIGFRTFNAALLFEPQDLFARSGRPFVQFTPFWRSCRNQSDPPPPDPGPTHLNGLPGVTAGPLAAQPLFPDRAGRGDIAPGTEWEPLAEKSDWQPGEAGAQRRVRRFLREKLSSYDAARDYPGIDGTSRLSPHLHFGEIGPRQMWQAIGGKYGGTPPGDAFLRQLGWREFGHYLLFHFPHMAEEMFRPEFAAFPWDDDPEGVEAWKRAQTGYPLVDAAMRQLGAEGWVHNRARMVAASFLVKDLLVDWRQGAAWFWERLVDADLANNTLGWQWTAGSGPDAAPYFRIFNPVLQAARYDPDGDYVRAWGEALSVNGQTAGKRARPIVQHDHARARALAAFRSVRSNPVAWPKDQADS